MRVYLSSTLIDLLSERQAVKDALGGECTVVESYTADGRSVRESCLDDVAGCDLYIGIIGLRYGIIPLDRKHSITQLEYQEARDRKITTLVFIKDEDEIKNRFCDAYTRENPRELIEAFRKSLTSSTEEAGRTSQFKTAEDLGVQVLKAYLGVTQRQSSQMLAGVQPGTPLAELIVRVTPALRDFTQKVTRIAHCKRVHDCLHDLRQQVLRPLQEEVLPRWKQAGELSMPIFALIGARAANLARCVGTLDTLLIDLPAPDHSTLRDFVSQVEVHAKRWDPAVIPEYATFTDKLDDLALAVENAFNEADTSMMREADTLRERFRKLQKDIDLTRKIKRLSEADDAKLTKSVTRLDELTDLLRGVLVVHNRWQSVHNLLTKLDVWQGVAGQFERQLKSFCAVPLDGLLELVRQRLSAADRSNGQNLLPLSLEYEVPACTDQDRKLSELARTVDMLRTAPDAKNYSDVRPLFDDAFYCVDKQTLAAVTHISARAEHLQSEVDNLNRDQSDVAKPGEA